MEYRLIKQKELKNKDTKFIYCFCGNPEDYEIITTDYLHIYNFMGDLPLGKISGKSTIYKFIRAYLYVMRNRESIQNTLNYLDLIDTKLVITCYDDFDMSPILYTVLNKLIKNRCTCILESDMIEECTFDTMKKIYGRLYFNFVYKKFYNNGIY